MRLFRPIYSLRMWFQYFWARVFRSSFATKLLVSLALGVYRLKVFSEYDPRHHAFNAVARLDGSDFKTMFSEGWCYSLAAECESRGMGAAVLLAKPLVTGPEICHAAVRLPNGGFYDVFGSHPDLESLSKAGSWGKVLVERPGRAAFFASELLEERAFWTGVPVSVLEGKLSIRIGEFLRSVSHH